MKNRLSRKIATHEVTRLLPNLSVAASCVLRIPMKDVGFFVDLKTYPVVILPINTLSHSSAWVLVEGEEWKASAKRMDVVARDVSRLRGVSGWRTNVFLPTMLVVQHSANMFACAVPLRRCDMVVTDEILARESPTMRRSLAQKTLCSCVDNEGVPLVPQEGDITSAVLAKAKDKMSGMEIVNGSSSRPSIESLVDSIVHEQMQIKPK